MSVVERGQLRGFYWTLTVCVLEGGKHGEHETEVHAGPVSQDLGSAAVSWLGCWLGWRYDHEREQLLGQLAGDCRTELLRPKAVVLVILYTQCG